MVDIEPYKYQKTTNIKEHNDLVAKINEIVDVINNTNLDTILPKISKLETDVSTIKATDSLQWTDIENLKTKNTEYDSHFGLNDSQIDGITKSLVSDVALMNGTTTGNVKVRIGRENAPSIDSDDYNIQKPTSVELVQGSAPAMVKAQITLSDGTVLISDDFMFTTEAIGQDVYISSFVFKNGNVAGTISADIGLSNGSTLTANNFAVPTDPNVTSAITDLQSRMSAVEGGSVGGLDELKSQVQTNTTNIGTLTTEIDNLDIQKADQNNSNQEIVAGTIKANNITKGGVNVATTNDIPDISGKVDIAQGINNAGKILAIGSDGNLTPTEILNKEWKVYTGELSNLFTVDNGTKSIRINKECIFEIMTSQKPLSFFSSFHLMKSSYVLSNLTGIKFVSAVSSNRFAGLEIKLTGEIIIGSGGSDITDRILTEEATITTNNYYKIYVRD